MNNDGTIITVSYVAISPFPNDHWIDRSTILANRPLDATLAR